MLPEIYIKKRKNIRALELFKVGARKLHFPKYEKFFQSRFFFNFRVPKYIKDFLLRKENSPFQGDFFFILS